MRIFLDDYDAHGMKEEKFNGDALAGGVAGAGRMEWPISSENYQPDD